jgi:hypothetical protein
MDAAFHGGHNALRVRLIRRRIRLPQIRANSDRGDYETLRFAKVPCVGPLCPALSVSSRPFAGCFSFHIPMLFFRLAVVSASASTAFCLQKEQL